MDKEIFVQNVKDACKAKGIKPTVACRESGVSTSFITNIEKGSEPSVAKVQMLAAYLGMTTSELLGEKKEHTPVSEDGLNEMELRLVALHRGLNREGQEELLNFANYLISTSKYIKSDSAGLGKEA